MSNDPADEFREELDRKLNAALAMAPGHLPHVPPLPEPPVHNLSAIEAPLLRSWAYAYAAAAVAAERERWAAPTEDMERAGMRALRNTYRTVSGEYSREQARACWDAMIRASQALNPCSPL